MLTKQQNNSATNTSCVKSDDPVLPRATNLNLRPVILLMALSGCYTRQGRKNICLSTTLLLYKGILTIAILFWIIRNCMLLSEPNMLLTFVTMTILSSQSICNLFLCWKAFSKKYGNYRETMKMFFGILSRISHQNISVRWKFFNRRVVAFSVSAVLLTMTGIICQGLFMFAFFPSLDEYGHFDHNLTIIYTQPLPDNTATRLLVYFAVCLHLLPFCVPGFFLMTMSVMFITVFRALNKRLDQVVSENNQNLLDHLENIRKVHLNLCLVVSKLDKDLGFIYGNIFFWTVGEALFFLYMIVRFTMPAITLFTVAYFLGFTVIMLVSMSIYAALVHKEAHAPLGMIYFIDVQDVKFAEVTQLNLFLSKLTGIQVGFTVCGLLTITKEFILTIAGVFLTYFTVLYTL